MVCRFLSLQTSYTQVPTCQVTTYYYVGFAYMMMRRYKDAIRSFSSILLYIQRTNYMVSTSGSYQIDVVSEKWRERNKDEVTVKPLWLSQILLTYILNGNHAISLVF